MQSDQSGKTLPPVHIKTRETADRGSTGLPVSMARLVEATRDQIRRTFPAVNGPHPATAVQTRPMVAPWRRRGISGGLPGIDFQPFRSVGFVPASPDTAPRVPQGLRLW